VLTSACPSVMLSTRPHLSRCSSSLLVMLLHVGAPIPEQPERTPQVPITRSFGWPDYGSVSVSLPNSWSMMARLTLASGRSLISSHTQSPSRPMCHMTQHEFSSVLQCAAHGPHVCVCVCVCMCVVACTVAKYTAFHHFA
jgi:hypothetical protein